MEKNNILGLLDNVLLALDPLSKGVDGIVDQFLEINYHMVVYKKKVKLTKKGRTAKKGVWIFTNWSRSDFQKVGIKVGRYQVVKKFAKNYNKS